MLSRSLKYLQNKTNYNQQIRIFSNLLFPINNQILNNNIDKNTFATEKFYKLKVPFLGESLHEAEVYKWNFEIGDKVNMSDEILVLETDKAELPILAPDNGVLIEKYFDNESIVEPGNILCKIKTK